jgi:hypothetical protein
LAASDCSTAKNSYQHTAATKEDMLEEEKTKKIYVRGRGKEPKTKKKEKGNHITSPTL